MKFVLVECVLRSSEFPGRPESHPPREAAAAAAVAEDIQDHNDYRGHRQEAEVDIIQMIGAR